MHPPFLVLRILVTSNPSHCHVIVYISFQSFFSSSFKMLSLVRITIHTWNGTRFLPGFKKKFDLSCVCVNIEILFPMIGINSMLIINYAR